MESNELKQQGVMSEGYGIIPKKIMKDKDLSIEAKAIYSFMASYAGAGNTSFPSVEFVTDHLGISRQRFNRHRKKLEDKGYLTILRESKGREGFSNNIYQLEMIPVPLQNVTLQNITSQNITSQNVTTNNNSSSSLTTFTNINTQDNTQNGEFAHDFESFWNLYDKKKDKPRAEKAFKKAYKKHGYQKIKEGTKLYLQTIEDKQYQKYPATFLSNESFLDIEEFNQDISNRKKQSNKPTTAYYESVKDNYKHLPF